MKNQEIAEVVKRQLNDDREEAASNRKFLLIVSGIVLVLLALIFIAVRFVGSIFWGEQPLSISAAAEILVSIPLILVGQWLISHFDGTIRDRRFVRMELKLDALADLQERTFRSQQEMQEMLHPPDP